MTEKWLCTLDVSGICPTIQHVVARTLLNILETQCEACGNAVPAPILKVSRNNRYLSCLYLSSICLEGDVSGGTDTGFAVLKARL